MKTKTREQKYGTMCNPSVAEVPDSFSGMYLEWHLNSKGERVYEQQYWVYGKGCYRKWKGETVYNRTKRLGPFAEVKDKLRKILAG